MSPSFERLGAIRQTLENVLLGKGTTVRPWRSRRVLAGGHLLLEDLPGVGKTTLAQALAGLRTRFPGASARTTSCLPTYWGVGLRRSAARTAFRAGPIFHQVLLADELNRASPKTQSALLEAMAERQVTVDGTSHPARAVLRDRPAEPPQAGWALTPCRRANSIVSCCAWRSAIRRPQSGETAARRRRRYCRTVGPAPVGRPQGAARLASRVRSLAVRRRSSTTCSRSCRRPARIPACGSASAARRLALLAAARARLPRRPGEFVLPEDVQAVFVAATAHRLATPRRSARGCQGDGGPHPLHGAGAVTGRAVPSWRKRLERWQRRRAATPGGHVLVTNRTLYILPTAAGAGYALTLLVLWLLAINCTRSLSATPSSSGSPPWRSWRSRPRPPACAAWRSRR